MTVTNTTLAGLRRPRILIESARIGVKSYRRKAALARLFKAKRPASQTVLIAQLIEQESEIELTRQLHDGTYNPRRHVQVMTALLAEAGRV